MFMYNVVNIKKKKKTGKNNFLLRRGRNDVGGQNIIDKWKL